MIMIIAIIYIFLSYVIFDQQLKTTNRKSSAPSTAHPPPRPPPFLPLKKSTAPFLLTPHM